MRRKLLNGVMALICVAPLQASDPTGNAAEDAVGGGAPTAAFTLPDPAQYLVLDKDAQDISTPALDHFADEAEALCEGISRHDRASLMLVTPDYRDMLALRRRHFIDSNARILMLVEEIYELAACSPFPGDDRPIKAPVAARRNIKTAMTHKISVVRHILSGDPFFPLNAAVLGAAIDMKREEQTRGLPKRLEEVTPDTDDLRTASAPLPTTPHNTPISVADAAADWREPRLPRLQQPGRAAKWRASRSAMSAARLKRHAP